MKSYSIQNRIFECIYLLNVVLYHHQQFKLNLQIRVTKFKLTIGDSFMQIWVIKEVMHGDSRKVHPPVTPRMIIH